MWWHNEPRWWPYEGNTIHYDPETRNWYADC